MIFLHFMGGNAAGKSTLVDTLHERWKRLADVAWLHGDGGEFGGDIREQFRVLMRYWSNPALRVIVLEGTRVYSTVFRCSNNARTPRRLYLGLMLQQYEDGLHHIQARCARRGKKYRGDFWERGDDEVGHLFHDRYTKGVAKFRREHPQAPIADVRTFWIGKDYAEIDQVHKWADSIIGTGTTLYA